MSIQTSRSYRFGPTKTRELIRIPTVHTHDECEMGDEDGCPNAPVYTLLAPATYTIPLNVCQDHADDEAFYFGTVVPS